MIRFTDYLESNGLINDATQIVHALITNDFKLISRSRNSNNYRYFLNADGILRFNNPNMQIHLDTLTLSAGVISPDRHGNTLELDNLYILNVDLTKEKLLNNLEKVVKEISQLKELEKNLRTQIDFLVSEKKDFLLEKEFNEYKLNKLKKKLKRKVAIPVE